MSSAFTLLRGKQISFETYWLERIFGSHSHHSAELILFALDAESGDLGFYLSLLLISLLYSRAFYLMKHLS